MLFDITSTPAQPYKSVCSIDHYNMHISLCFCDFENELSIINQVFSINNHWKYGLYFDIATSSVSNEHSPILVCIVIYQQVIWNMNSWWINCWNTCSTRTLSSITFTFNTYFSDELCLVVIDFSANTDWTLDEALIYMYIVVFCEWYILCCKWMCWNLMWVELCGNYFLLCILSM